MSKSKESLIPQEMIEDKVLFLRRHSVSWPLYLGANP